MAILRGYKTEDGEVKLTAIQPNQFSRAFMLQQERQALSNRIQEIDGELLRVAKPDAH